MKETEKRNMRLALRNSTVISILLLAVLMLAGTEIYISIGYMVVTFIATLPVYYLSFKHKWNNSPILSFRRLYTPLLILASTMILALLYTPLVYCSRFKDFFITPEGFFYSNNLFILIKYSVSSVFLVFIIQLLGASNEHEIVINESLSDPKKESEEKTPVEDSSSVIQLHGGTKNSNIQLDLNRFLYAESDANYLNINLFENRKKTLTIRFTIKQFEEAVSSFPYIMRCHRAFVVNIHNISYLDITSGKGIVHFKHTEDTIPVSKTYSQELSRKLQNKT